MYVIKIAEFTAHLQKLHFTIPLKVVKVITQYPDTSFPWRDISVHSFARYPPLSLLINQSQSIRITPITAGELKQTILARIIALIS